MEVFARAGASLLASASTIMRADVVTAILRAQGLPTNAPFIQPCRGPPSGELIEVWWR